MKIKLKVKHIILTVVGFLFFIPITTVFIIPQAQLYVGGKQLAAGEMNGKEKILKALEKRLFPDQRWGIIQKYIMDGGVSQPFDVYVGPSSTQVNHHAQGINFTWEEKLPYLKDYLAKGPIDGYLTTAASQLSYYYQREANFEKADEVLKQASARYSSSQYSFNQEELELERIKLHIKQSNYEAAEELIDELKTKVTPGNHHIVGSLASLEAEVMLREDRLEEGYDLVTHQLQEFNEQWEEEKRAHPEDSDVGTPVALEQLLSLKGYLERALEKQNNGVTTVKGKVVRSNGKAVPNAGVFLRQEQAVNHSVMEDEPYQMVTDEDGNFEFTGVLPGNYQLYLGLTFDQIDGWAWPVEYGDWIQIDGQETERLEATLHPLLELHSPVNQEVIETDTMEFSWEPVNGAAFYDIHLGVELGSGSIGTVFKTGIEENHLTVSLEELYNQQVGVMFEDTEDWSSVDPISILAFTNTENKFSWSVKAYSQNGEMITQSNGYRLNEDSIGNLPFFYLQARDMTEADELFLDKKVEQAFEKYKDEYADNPNDYHSLRMIVRMMGIEAAQTGKTRAEAVLPYLIKWAEVSKDPDVTLELADYYHKERNWEEYDYWYEKYLKLKDSN
ncbi:MAG: carboxypeptidase regulatory-like domain-containing protein [Bacillota bacterium]